MAKNVVLTADKLRKRKKLIKYVQMAALGITATMAASFAMLSLVYNGGDFTITLNREMTTKNGIILYNNSITKNSVNKGTEYVVSKDIEIYSPVVSVVTGTKYNVTVKRIVYE